MLYSVCVCVCFPSRLLCSSKKGFFRYCCSWCCCCVNSLKKIHWETFLERNCAANETSLQMLELWNEIECTFCVLNYIRILAQSGQFAVFSSIDFTISLDVCFTKYRIRFLRFAVVSSTHERVYDLFSLFTTFIDRSSGQISDNYYPIVGYLHDIIILQFNP